MNVISDREHRIRNAIHESPEKIARLVGAKFYPKQAELYRAVLNPKVSRVTASGANGTGKDYTAARIMVAWMIRYWRESQVIVFGPSQRQIQDIVFAEAREALDSWIPDDYRHGLTSYATPLIKGVSDRNAARGFNTSDQSQGWTALGGGRQGYHMRYQLVIITEAHAVDRSVFEIARRLDPTCVLLTGNPFSTSGEFYDSHHSKRHLYYPISISAHDTPNFAPNSPDDGLPQFPGMISKRGASLMAEDWGEQSPLYLAGVLGQFPPNLDDGIVPLSVVTEAASRESVRDEEAIVACDVARFGRDKTIVMKRQGNVARIVWQVQGRDTQQIAGWLGAYCHDHRVDTLVIDDTGVGGGVTDRLREEGVAARLVAFNGGERANNERRYANAISEVWFRMRYWFLAQGEFEGSQADIENSADLIGQVSGRGYSYQGDRRIRIQSKREMSTSPDEADALAMTFVPLGRKPRVTII